MTARGDCGRRPFGAGVPGGQTERVFVAGCGDRRSLAHAATFVPLHVIIGGADAPADLSRDLVRYRGVDRPPAEQVALAETGLLGTEASLLFDRCPLAVASPACPAPAPAEWLRLALEARSLAAAGLTAWSAPREQTTEAVRAAAVEIYAATEAAAAYRRGFKPEMKPWN